MNNKTNIEEDVKILEWVTTNKLYIDTHNECDYHIIHQAIENILADRERLEKENNKFMNAEVFSAKQVKFNEEQREKYFVHKSKVEKLQAKADKCNALVEELKEHIKDWYKGNYVYGSDKFIEHLQKLISKENKQC